MKKIILPILLITASFFANAQCVPGAMTLPLAGYIIPDSATNFVTGCAGQPYDQVIYIKAPADTLFNGVPANVDSFVVDANIVGLPAFLTMTCVPGLTPASPPNPKTNFSRLIIPGDSLACIKISGNIPAGTSGNNVLTIGVRAYLRIGGVVPVDTAANITYYHINIMNPCWAAGVNDMTQKDFSILHAVPNPASATTQITFNSVKADYFEYKVLNSIGEVVMQKSIKADIGNNYIALDVSNLNSGLYMFSLSNGGNLLTQKIVVSK